MPLVPYVTSSLLVQQKLRQLGIDKFHSLCVVHPVYEKLTGISLQRNLAMRSRH